MQLHNNALLISLIIGYVERNTCLRMLLDSLAKQTFKQFEVIIVDQSADNQAKVISQQYRQYYPVSIIHAPPAQGISRARNIGLKKALGYWCAFPDDDCVYPDNLLEKVRNWLSSNPGYCGLSCLVTDCNNHFSAGGYMSRQENDISFSNIWRTVVSPSLFLKTEDVIAVGGFDERLGVGVKSQWCGGEETEMVMKLIEDGCVIRYYPAYKVIHPQYQGKYDLNKMMCGWRCGCGCGAVMKIHQTGFLVSIYYAALQFFRAGQQVCLLRIKRACFHFAMALGRLYGRLTFNM
ncbi:MAG: glycosyltransferase family A protein [Victivallales bacterium]|nr:glycosyltransferase family A protein [Victivallales bacterium]